MYIRKTISILAVLLFLNLCLGTAVSTAATTDGVDEVKYSVSISKNAGTTVVKAADGKTIYSGTNDAEAVRSALNSISQGAILFNPGTYTISSPVAIKSNIGLIGNSAVIKGYTIFRMNGATNVTIRGFEFSNPDLNYLARSGGVGLVDIINSNNIIIQDNTFRNFRDYGVNVAVSSTSHSNRQITVKNNQFLDYGYAGVMIGKQSNYIYVDNNVFKNINTRKLNANAYGVALAKGSVTYKYSEYVYIRNNWIENNPVWEGIDSHGANHVYIQDNTVINCKIPIIVAHINSEGTYPEPVHHVTITGNYVKGNLKSADKQHSGIHVLGARNNVQPYQNVIVSDNTIVDVNSWLVSDDGGIVLRDVKGATVENNQISNVGGTGIYLLNADNLLIQNNNVKSMFRISGPTKGLKLMPVNKDCTITVKNNVFDSSVEYQAYGYSNWGYKYRMSILNQDTTKFYNPNGVLQLTILKEAEPSAPISTDINIYKSGTTTTVKAADGKTIYSGSSDVDAVRAAVNAANKNTIVFNEGSYAISSAVVLKSDIGLSGNKAVLNGYNIFRMNGVTNVTITGFVFSNPDALYLGRAGNNGLIDIQNSKDILVRDNTFRNFRDFGIFLATRTTSDRNQDVTIKGNQFLDYGYCGIMIGKQASSVTIENNVFRNVNTRSMYANSYGIAVMKASSTYDYSEYLYIRSNIIENIPTGEAIDSHGANHLYIEDNTITDCRIPMYIVHINDDDKYPAALSNLSVTGNYVKGNYAAEKQDPGIYVFGGRNAAGTITMPYMNVNISGNRIEDVNNWLLGNDGAIVFKNVDGAMIDSNEISGAGGTGVNLQNADNVVMQNNVISSLRNLAGSTICLKLLPVDNNYGVLLRNNSFDAAADYHAYSYPTFGYVYEVSVSEQDISKFYFANDGMNLIFLDEPSDDELPVANAGARYVTAGSPLTFYGGESTDRYGIISYSWDFDASNGIQKDASGMLVTHTFEKTGSYDVTLTVSNMRGQTSTDTLKVIVN
ncbi:MAG: right-handed parallel beta-helix repeat-containing protein [Methanolobus sp.]|uniref:right-handed parallel beta-helix repeat-containing protein n=1 Tax=Methanolobus sp. TaxID=1874737 RepID=UPI002730F95C|nr:right-handed parallel beta-helix repeat-containing protein [Methanolobus sp.]MDP2216893.1 right-handed parallel beta-helix repeat-containing protein [Methanolobus sp.]